jgi:hypothetical protein
MTRRRPVREKDVQTQIIAALRSIGATVCTIGRPPRRDRPCPSCGTRTPTRKGTGQTAGIPDLVAFLPHAAWKPHGPEQTTRAHQLWIEVKAAGGTRSPAQLEFADRCQDTRQPYLVGGLDEVLDYLLTRGYIREVAHYRSPHAKEAPAPRLRDRPIF